MIEIFEIQIYVGDNCESYASRENQNIKDCFQKTLFYMPLLLIDYP